MTIRDLISLAEAAKLAPNRPSSNTIYRWCREGLMARTGRRIKLRHVRGGQAHYTREVWLAKFFDELTAEDDRYFQRDVKVRLSPKCSERLNNDNQQAVTDEDYLMEEGA